MNGELIARIIAWIMRGKLHQIECLVLSVFYLSCTFRLNCYSDAGDGTFNWCLPGISN